MKILIVSRPFVFHGGVETATAGFVAALVAHGHDVHLLSLPGQSPMPGVTLHTLPLPRLPRTARLLALAVAGPTSHARPGWDVVQSHERTLGQDVYRAGEGCHRAYLETLGDQQPRRGYHRMLLALERRVFTTTPHGRGHLAARRRRDRRALRGAAGPAERRLQRRRPRALPPGQPGAPSEPGARRGRRPRRAFTVVFAGSGFERKGLATAIQALAALADRDSRLLVLGKGDRGPWSSSRVASESPTASCGWDRDRTSSAGTPPPTSSRSPPATSRSATCISRRWPPAIPVVTTTRAGGAEAITPWSGAVVEPDDAPALVTALEWLRGLEPARLTSAARAAAEPFTWERQVADFEQIYRKLPATRGGLS